MADVFFCILSIIVVYFIVRRFINGGCINNAAMIYYHILSLAERTQTKFA